MRSGTWLDSRDSTKGSSPVNQPRYMACSSRRGRSKHPELDLGRRFDMMSQGANAMMIRNQVHLVVRGRVQGVYFRASTQHEAHRLGVVGWVKNLPDGRVEIVAEGSREALEELVQWAHKGPRAAHVEHVDVEWRPFERLPAGFRIVE